MLQVVRDPEVTVLDILVARWELAISEDRDAFVSYLRINGFIPSSNPEQADVDRSAERASSAVEVGAPVSPEGAQATTVLMQEPHVEAEGQGGVIHEHGREEGSHPRLPSDPAENKPRATAVIAGAPIPPSAATPAEAVAESQAPRPSATAEISSSEAPSPPGVTEKAEAPSSSPGASAAIHCPANPAVADGQPSTPTPDALAAGQGAMPGSIAKSGDAVSNFINPRCQHPGICPFANSREAFHDCLMDWSKRPKDEQIRLWAEANEAARASA